MNFSQSFLLDHVTNCFCLIQTSVDKQRGNNATTVENLPQSLLEQLNTILFLVTFSISERYSILPLSVLSVPKYIWSLQTTISWFQDMVVKSGHGNAICDTYADWNIYLQLLWLLTHHMMKTELYLTI